MVTIQYDKSSLFILLKTKTTPRYLKKKTCATCMYGPDTIYGYIDETVCTSNIAGHEPGLNRAMHIYKPIIYSSGVFVKHLLGAMKQSTSYLKTFSLF